MDRQGKVQFFCLEWYAFWANDTPTQQYTLTLLGLMIFVRITAIFFHFSKTWVVSFDEAVNDINNI